MSQINETSDSIKALLDMNLKINLKNLKLEIMSKFGISQRTAKEYVDVAIYNLGLKIKDIEDAE